MYRPIAYIVCGIIMFLIVGVVAAAEFSDPTRPGRLAPAAKIAKTAKKAALVLNSTLISDQRTLAVINGKSVLKGERIGKYRLVEVKPGKVKLKQGSRILLLTLLPNRVKRPTATSTQRNK